MKIEPGIYFSVPFDEYLQWEAVSNTILTTILDKSPAHAKYKMDNPQPPTPAMLQGAATHCLILEPDRFFDRYAIMPECDRRTKEGKAVYETFSQAAQGKTILSQDQYGIALQISEAIKTQNVYKVIAKGKAEVCIVWIDKITGLLCKGRLDFLHDGYAWIMDLKTTKDANPNNFWRSVIDYHYDQQAAFYSDGYKTLRGNLPTYILIPSEKEPPFCSASYQVNEKHILVGRLRYRQALSIYAKCPETGIWHGYSKEAQMLKLPDWYLKQNGVNDYRLYNEE